jgi:hypothetical protein
MDERQAQIKEGAGLEESRINQEFLDFLNKWSFPVLLIIAIVSGGYFVYNQYQVRKIAKRDEAFAQLGSIESTPNPSVVSLTGIADEYEGVGSVAELALLRAAGIHLNAARTGIDPSADPGAGDEAVMGEADIAFHLEQAQSLYRRVADRVSGDSSLSLFAVNAAFGLGAAAETGGDLDGAREQYAKAESLATAAGFASLAEVAKELGASVGNETSVTLYEFSAFPRLPFEPEPMSLESITEVLEANGMEVPAEEQMPGGDGGADDGAPGDGGAADGDGTPAGAGDGEPSDG